MVIASAEPPEAHVHGLEHFVCQADAGGEDVNLSLASALRHSIAIANWNSALCVVGHNEQHTLAVSCGVT